MSFSLQEVQKLCEDYHIILLQETWLAKQNLCSLSTISENHYACGIAVVDYESGLQIGRPHGGTAILWDKSLDASTLKANDESIVGLNLHTFDSSISIINVYLPYCCSANTDDYLMYLNNLQTMCDNLKTSNICIMGDFNAGDCNMFGQLLDEFCTEQDYIISDKLVLPSDTFTYVSDSHGTTSWIDHCLTSASVHQSIINMSVLHNYISSDHRPLAITITSSNLPVFENVSSSAYPSYIINWAMLSQEQKYEYNLNSKKFLNQISLPSYAIACKNPQCEDHSHIKSIEKFYKEIVEALLNASAFIRSNSRNHRKHIIPAWNSQVKKAHSASRTAYLKWVKSGNH